ncbi:MAG: GNAT family N-acyltransferase [Bacteroidales bacterium]|nr:GNAT family N-acyltransferase [Bacteroidales bacterium]
METDSVIVHDSIIPPIDVRLIESELTKERFLRKTNKGGNEIYVLEAATAPNTMREIGRLREIAFRGAGGGTGTECDIDAFDLMDPPCRQLIVWDPEERIILGGYRFIFGRDIRMEKPGVPRIATSHMFTFSPEFIDNYLPYTVELGRSFVRTEYQSSKSGAKAIYTLDNLWDGLGALTVIHPEIKYLFGKVTMYPGYLPQCRNMILYFLHKHFPDPDNLVRPIRKLNTNMDIDAMGRLFCGQDFKSDYRILNAEIRRYGFNIPPLVNAYMSLSPGMRMFGTAINTEFGDVEESAIFMAIDDIYDVKKHRHISSFNPNEPAPEH